VSETLFSSIEYQNFPDERVQDIDHIAKFRRKQVVDFWGLKQKFTIDDAWKKNFEKGFSPLQSKENRKKIVWERISMISKSQAAFDINRRKKNYKSEFLLNWEIAMK